MHIDSSLKAGYNIGKAASSSGPYFELSAIPLTVSNVSCWPNSARQARQFYERKKARTNPVVARKVLAHKMARACFHMLKKRKPFDVTRCFA
jgi:hypothetical protein